MGFATIIGIDLGKFKSVACVLDAATRQLRFCTFDTTPAALHELLSAYAGASDTQPTTLLAPGQGQQQPMRLKSEKTKPRCAGGIIHGRRSPLT